MGAPKLNWSSEEEAALKAGVVKHGAGKWRTILTDPEFSSILLQRSNVDLQDKWRNINVTAICGSRQRAKLAFKSNLPVPKHEMSLALVSVLQNNHQGHDGKFADGIEPATNSKEPASRLNYLIIEAIFSLKYNKGSDRSAIAAYIEEHYLALPYLKKMLPSKLKHLNASGKLIKVNHKYRIAPCSFSNKRKGSSLVVADRRPKDSPIVPKTKVTMLTKAQFDADITKIKGMTAQDAAATAAQAVAVAEAAIAKAAEAEAEAEAEAAQIFAKATMKALKSRMLHDC